MRHNVHHMGRTLVAFHAHPDDEALLTSGTMARAAAEGHRVVLVVATDGGLGLAASEYVGSGDTSDTALGSVRMAELQASAHGPRHGARRDPRVCRQRPRARDPPRPAGPGALRARRPRGGGAAAGRRSCARRRPTCCSPTTPTAATATATTSRCTRSGRGRPRSPAPPRSCRPRCPATSWCGRSGWPGGSTGSRPSSTPRRFERAYSPSAGGHPPHLGAPVCRAEAGGDARPRVAGQCRRRRRPHPGRVPAHTAAAVRPRLRPRVVRRRRPPGRPGGGP